MFSARFAVAAAFAGVLIVGVPAFAADSCPGGFKRVCVGPGPNTVCQCQWDSSVDDKLKKKAAIGGTGTSGPSTPRHQIGGASRGSKR